MDKNTGTRLHVRTKTWIENDQQDLLFGKGKTEILELIEQEGSIAKAAEKMGMNYPLCRCHPAWSQFCRKRWYLHQR
jgi:hypothetical protein